MQLKTQLLSYFATDRVARATPEKRIRGKCMSRRSGQSGYIEASGKYYVVRFWKDVPNQEKRVHASERICPISGPGRLTKPERQRKARDIIVASGVDSPQYFAKVTGIGGCRTFSEQAVWWLEHVQQRKRKPVAPATVDSLRDCLDVWLLPNLGDLPVSTVGNLALKELVQKMVKGGLSPKSIKTYSQVVKAVVASAVTEDGEQLFPRKWNHDYIDMPLVVRSNQNTPHFTSEVIEGILA